jgi:hypothetical protein
MEGLDGLAVLEGQVLLRQSAGSHGLPYPVAMVVQKAPSTYETLQPTQTPPGSQIPPAEAAS